MAQSAVTSFDPLPRKNLTMTGGGATTRAEIELSMEAQALTMSLIRRYINRRRLIESHDTEAAYRVSIRSHLWEKLRPYR